MGDLAKLAAAAVEYAKRGHLTIVPALPSSANGPEVTLGPDELPLSEFVELAAKLGSSALYLKTELLHPDAADGLSDDEIALVASHKGQVIGFSAAFAANGIVHFWEAEAAWYTEWQESRDEDQDDEAQEDQSDDGKLSDEERDRLAGELVETLLANPQYRAARFNDRWRMTRSLIPPGTVDRVRWRAEELARDRAQEMIDAQFDALWPRLDDLVAELIGTGAYRQARSAPGRKHAIEQFIVSHPDGFWRSDVLRDELYARAQELGKGSRRSPGGLF